MSSLSRELLFIYLEKITLLMKKLTTVKCLNLLLVVLICLAVTGAEASTMSLESLYGGITEKQGESIISELKQIRVLLGNLEKKLAIPKKEKRKAHPKTVSVSIKNTHILGNPDAPVTLVEFSDYQCPFCVKFSRKVYPKLKKKYIDTGKLRVVVRSMPLSFHKLARKAAQAAYCAGEQGLARISCLAMLSKWPWIWINSRAVLMVLALSTWLNAMRERQAKPA